MKICIINKKNSNDIYSLFKEKKETGTRGNYEK